MTLFKSPILIVDTETTGLDVLGADKVFGFSLSLPGGGDFYFDIRTNPRAVEWINDEFARFPGTIVCHNLSFDYKASTNTGIEIPLSKCVDTVVLACLINEHEISYSLDNLSKRYLSIGNQKQGDELYKEMAKIFGGRATKNVQMRNISSAPEHLVAEKSGAPARCARFRHPRANHRCLRAGRHRAAFRRYSRQRHCPSRSRDTI